MSRSPRPTTDPSVAPSEAADADEPAASATAPSTESTGGDPVVATDIAEASPAAVGEERADGSGPDDSGDLPAGIDDEPAGRGAPAASAHGRGSSGQGSSGRRQLGNADRRRLAGWLAMLAIVAGALFVGVTDDGGPRTDGERARDLSASIACPTCDGQSVADSDSSAAGNVRTFIERGIADGESDDQIRDELAARYGERILLTPGRSGLAGLVWVLPVAVLVAALAGVALAFRRWRGRGVVHATDEDRALVDEARSAVPSGSSASSRSSTSSEGG